MTVRTYYCAQNDTPCAFCGGTIRRREWHLKRRREKKLVPWCGCAAGRVDAVRSTPSPAVRDISAEWREMQQGKGELGKGETKP